MNYTKTKNNKQLKINNIMKQFKINKRLLKDLDEKEKSIFLEPLEYIETINKFRDFKDFSDFMYSESNGNIVEKVDLLAVYLSGKMITK